MQLSLAFQQRAFRNLDLVQLPLQLGSLIIAALGGKCEFQKAASTLGANIFCSGPVDESCEEKK
jgi:hypothetical protein